MCLLVAAFLVLTAIADVYYVTRLTDPITPAEAGYMGGIKVLTP